MEEWPQQLAINAWTGDEAPNDETSRETRRWALQCKVPVDVRKTLAPPTEAYLGNWRDERVGWGLVLPEKPDTLPAHLAWIIHERRRRRVEVVCERAMGPLEPVSDGSQRPC